MKVLAIDPGTTESAFCLISDGVPERWGKVLNASVLELLDESKASGDVDVVACEMIASYGLRVGREIFETCVWIGRFLERWGGRHELIYRKDEVRCLGVEKGRGSADSQVREALIRIYGAPGSKRKPGPLLGMANDMWAALAVGHTYLAMRGGRMPPARPSSWRRRSPRHDRRPGDFDLFSL